MICCFVIPLRPIVVFIASSTPTHLSFITKAAKYKKIIFCEKPIDLNIKKVVKCRKNIKKYNPRIQIGFNRRFDPGHHSLKESLAKGKIVGCFGLTESEAGSDPSSIKTKVVKKNNGYVLNGNKNWITNAPIADIYIIWAKDENNTVNDKFLASIISFIYLYIIIFFILTALLSLTGLDFVTSISGAATSISNVGPGLGSAIGPNGNFYQLPDVSKWILSTGMILGRLELFAILVLFLPSFWRS